MRILFIPLLRFIAFLFRAIFITLAILFYIVQYVIVLLWTFKPIDSFYQVLSYFHSEFFFDRYEVLNMDETKYYYWPNPLVYIFDINNNQRKLNEKRKYYSSRSSIGIPR